MLMYANCIKGINLYNQVYKNIQHNTGKVLQNSFVVSLPDCLCQYLFRLEGKGSNVLGGKYHFIRPWENILRRGNLRGISNQFVPH